MSFDIGLSRILCSFINQSERGNIINTCSIVYGYSHDQENCTSRALSSYSDSNVVVIGIPLSNQQPTQQRNSCFTVTASNGTFTAKVEGKFIRGTDMKSNDQSLNLLNLSML